MTEVETAAGTVTAATAAGPGIQCKALVFATGYEMPHTVPQRRHRVISTYAIATKRQPRNLWPEQCFIWEAADPYLYLRSTTDGRVICGGEDEEFSDEKTRDALIPRKAAAIGRKLKRLLPRTRNNARVRMGRCLRLDGDRSAIDRCRAGDAKLLRCARLRR